MISEREMDAAAVAAAADGLLAMVLYCHLDSLPQLDLALREVLVVGMSGIDAVDVAVAADEIDSWRPDQDVRVAHAHACYAHSTHIHRHLVPNAGWDISQQDVPNRVDGGSYYFACVVDHGCCEDALDLLPHPSSALRGEDDETAGREDDGDWGGDTEVACGYFHPSGPMRDDGGADGGPHSMHLCERMLPKM